MLYYRNYSDRPFLNKCSIPTAVFREARCVECCQRGDLRSCSPKICMIRASDTVYFSELGRLEGEEVSLEEPTRWSVSSYTGI